MWEGREKLVVPLSVILAFRLKSGHQELEASLGYIGQNKQTNKNMDINK